MTGRAILIVLAVGLVAAVAYCQGPLAGDEPVPPRHPPMGPRPGSMMPGRPAMGDMGEAVSQPDVKGSLTVRAEQASKDGQPVAGDSVVVELYRMGQPTDVKFHGKLDSSGVAIFDPLPAKNGDQAVVTVTHGGEPFVKGSEAITTEYPDRAVRVKVYEAAEAAPAWRIAKRQIMIMPFERGGRTGVSVYETVEVENPTDRVWPGTPGPAGGRTTMTLDLPTGLASFIGGQKAEFNRENVKYDPKDGRLTIATPMPPGTSQYDFSYVMLAEGGKADLTILAPRVTGQLVVFMPQHLAARCSVQGLSETPGYEGGQTYGASDVAPGTKASFQFANLNPGISPQGQRSDSDAGTAPPGRKVTPGGGHGGESSGKATVAVIAGLLLTAGLGYLLLRPARKPPQKRA